MLTRTYYPVLKHVFPSYPAHSAFQILKNDVGNEKMGEKAECDREPRETAR